MKCSRRVLALSVCVATLSAAAGGATATAAGSSEVRSDMCDPLAQPALLAPAAGEQFSGRGGTTAREPDLGQTHEDLPPSAKGRAGSRFSVEVPVYFHVVTDGTAGALTDDQIQDQIEVLNRTFAGREGGDRTGFSFELAGVTRTDDPAWFHAGPGGINENSMKRALRRGGPESLNFYSTTAGGYLGWAYLPNIVSKPGQVHLDGVVVDWESMLGTSTRYAGQYDQGETATHEVGHWLDLEHTFYGGCNAKGDFVEDTPAQKTPTRGCPEGKDTCPDPGLDPIHNYMDYSYDTCYTEFTAGQTQRMRDAWLHYRVPS